MNTNIGILKSKEVANILEVILASETLANLKIRKAHWNLQSPSFIALHEFFGELYEASSENMDEIAERIRMLSFPVAASYKHFLEISLIEESVTIVSAEGELCTGLLKDKEILIQYVRTAIIKAGELGDVGTEDFLTGLIQKYEKEAWMIASHIGK